MQEDQDCRHEESPEYFHDTLPGVKWCFSANPRIELANDRFGVDFCLRMTVSSLRDENGRQQISPATAAFAGFRVQMKAKNGSLSTPAQMDLKPFCFANPAWGLPTYAEHATVGQFCDDDDGSLTFCGNIFLEMDHHSESARQMFANPQYADFSLTVESETYHLHKYVLHDVSQCFRELITRPTYQETDTSVSQQAMITLLQHVYGYRLWFKDLPLLACEVMALADKLQVETGLKKLCLTGLRESMTPRNVISLYTIGVEGNYGHLRILALDCICVNARLVLASLEWRNLKEQNSTAAMAICDYLLDRLRPIPPPRAFTLSAASASQPSSNAEKIDATANTTVAEVVGPPSNVDTIHVKWQIPDFRSKCKLSPTSVSKKFAHDNLPGVTFELVVRFQSFTATGVNISVALRHVTTSSKKSPATTPKSGFLLAFANPATPDLKQPVRELPLQAIRCDDQRVSVSTLVNEEVLKRIYADDGSSVHLIGKIVTESASCRQINLSRRLFESEENSDFKVKFGLETFNAHKFVLSSSPVISGMFRLSCSEMDKQELTIRADTSAEAVKAMLQFWYGDPLSFEGLQDLAADVLLLAGEYQDWDLLKICETALIKLIQLDNVFSLAAIAFLHNTPELARSTSEFLFANFDALLRSQGDEWSQIKETNTKLAVQIAETVICR